MPVRVVLAVCHRREQRLDDLLCPIPLPGERQHLQEAVVDLHGGQFVGVRTGALEGRLCAGQRSRSEGAACGVEPQAGGAMQLACGLGQLGGQLAPGVVQLRMRRLHCRQRTPGEDRHLGREQLVQHGIARQCVAEPERRFGRIDGEDLRIDRPPERRQHLCLAAIGDPRQQAPLEPPPEHGCGEKHRPGVVTQRHKPSADAVGERGGDDGASGLRQRPRPAVADERTGAHPGRQQLLDEERDAAGTRSEREDVAVDRCCAEARLHHLGNLIRPEAGQPDDRRHTPGTDLLRHVQCRRRLLVAQGHEAERRLAQQVVRQVLRHPDGVRVAPVEVLEHQDAAAAAADDPQEPQHRLRDRDHGVVDGQRRLRLPLRDEPAERPPVRAEVVTGDDPGADGGAERLGERSVRHRRRRRNRTAAKHRKPSPTGIGCHLRRQPRLTDACLPDDEDHRPGTRDRGVERTAKLLDLRIPTNDAPTARFGSEGHAGPPSHSHPHQTPPPREQAMRVARSSRACRELDRSTARVAQPRSRSCPRIAAPNARACCRRA